MKQSHRYILMTIATLVGFGVIYWGVTTSQSAQVTDFESCVEKTGEIQESFPRQCTYDGMSFTEEIDNPDAFVDLSLPEDERDFINAWIAANDLNQYGDPLDTVYMGGTPLFDETTGETTPRYEYLVANHPTKPWMNPDELDQSQTPPAQGPSSQEPSSAPETTEPLSFTDVEAWQIYEHPNFTIDYPNFATVGNGTDYPIRITTTNDFSFAIHAPVEPSGEGECTQSIELGVDGYIYLCHNNNPRYISVYQRMIDSILPR